MKFLKCLPRVHLCCYCIKLKIGCIVIAALHILFVIESFLNVGGNDEFSRCYTSPTVTRLISYVSLIISITLVAAIIYLLYGIFRGLAEPVLWFMYISLVLLVYNLCISLLLFTSTKTGADCSPAYVLGIVTFLITLGQVYSLMVLASYYRELQTTGSPASKRVSPKASNTSKGKNKEPTPILIDEDNT